jgi:hypothetical protein
MFLFLGMYECSKLLLAMVLGAYEKISSSYRETKQSKAYTQDRLAAHRNGTNCAAPDQPPIVLAWRSFGVTACVSKFCCRSQAAWSRV